jgi:hypothetical protein
MTTESRNPSSRCRGCSRRKTRRRVLHHRNHHQRRSCRCLSIVPPCRSGGGGTEGLHVSWPPACWPMPNTFFCPRGRRFRNGFRFRVSSLTNVRLACLLVSKESNALEFRFTPRRAVSDHPASRTRAVHLGSCAALCPFIADSREGFWLFAPPLDLLCGFFFLMPPARPPHVLSLPATFASSSSLCAPLSLSAPSPPSLVSLPSALSPCSMLLAPSSLLLVEIKTYTSRKSAVYIHEQG